MSTEFDGEVNTGILTPVGSLGSAGTVNRSGMGCAFLWKPLEVTAGGLFNGGNNGLLAVNPYADSLIYFSLRNGLFTNSEALSGIETAGDHYSTDDGWRIDFFRTKQNGSDMEVYRHTYFYNTNTWTDVLIDSRGGWTGTETFSGTVELGRLDNDEVGMKRVGVIGVWAFGAADLSPTAIHTMHLGLYAWDALSATALWDLEDATSKNIDPRGDGISASSSAGISYSSDEPSGWTYSLSPPTNARMYYRTESGLIETKAKGAARIGDTSYPFG